MNFFRLTIQSVQHIKFFQLDIDLTAHRLICLVGRNGVGKTTMIRALRNLSSADTFLKTANPQIFNNQSRIEYLADDHAIEFVYDQSIRSLNCKSDIPKEVREAVSAELPMPHGTRFNHFKSASDADSDIRQLLIIAKYSRPTELIDFLTSIYQTSKYEDLAEVTVKGRAYYCIVLDDDRYIREDHLSSGEYFLINLYRAIRGASRLIAVDEIDVSLDPAAQVKLAGWLRDFCTKYGCNILFTTHSLAVMQTLKHSEMSYVEEEGGATIHHPVSYSYAKARLFGFHGWDRYILTEDPVLRDFIEHIIHLHCASTFFRYKVIYIGGGSQVVDLLQRNAKEEFLAEPNSVMAVLDGDQRGTQHAKDPAVHLIPVDSVEKAILHHYYDADFPFKLAKQKKFTGSKDAYNQIVQQKMATTYQLFEYICQKYPAEIEQLARTLGKFLGAKQVS